MAISPAYTGHTANSGVRSKSVQCAFESHRGHPTELPQPAPHLRVRREGPIASYPAVLCHGVLMYVQRPDPRIASLAQCLAPGGLVSVMALNAKTLAVRPALERRDDALAAFDTKGERGVLDVDTRADTSRSYPNCFGCTGWYRWLGTASGCSQTGWTSQAPTSTGYRRSSCKPVAGTPIANSAGSSTWSVIVKLLHSEPIHLPVT